MTFLTRLPGPRWLAYDPDLLARSTTYFPLIGVLVGLWGAAVFWAASLAWSPTIAAVCATAATVWLTGAFHEDALADSFDGFGGGWERDHVLAIMKDSRIGSYGAVGLTLVLLARVGALAGLGAAGVDTAARALVAAHTLGRWSSLPLIWALPYVREEGAAGSAAEAAKSRPFAASVTGPRLTIGTAAAVVVTGAALAPLGRAAVAAVLAAAAFVTWASARYFRRRLGGMTGDCLGAANQGVELATYLLLASAWLRH